MAASLCTLGYACFERITAPLRLKETWQIGSRTASHDAFYHKNSCTARMQVAPGVDLKRDVLEQMDFEPIVKDVKLMDARCFSL